MSTPTKTIPDKSSSSRSNVAQSGTPTDLQSHYSFSPVSQEFEKSLSAGFIDAKAEGDGAFNPLLIVNRNDNNLDARIKLELSYCTSFKWSVAFITPDYWGRNLLAFDDFFKRMNTLRAQGINVEPSKIITSTYQCFNKPELFHDLLKLQEESQGLLSIRIWKPTDTTHQRALHFERYNLHAKGYVFEYSDGASVDTDFGTFTPSDPYYSLYVGSSNLTSAAMLTNREWNLRVVSRQDGSVAQQVLSEFEQQWNEVVPLTNEWISEYEDYYAKFARPRVQAAAQVNQSQEISPNAMQQRALTQLRRLREAGETRALVVSATGTGKTYLSAFDVKNFFTEQKRTNGAHAPRMLYLVHQEQILQSAMTSYKRILVNNEISDADFGEFTGSHKDFDKRIVFATVQTMSDPEKMHGFAPDAFDYILIDEAHHSAANSYQRLMNYFTPQFWLGMTATPERTDNADIFKLFGNNIAANIRLRQALDENMLCPFNYMGIAEYIGSDGTSLASNDKHLAHEISQLVSPERVDYIIRKIEELTPYGQVRGLVFCSSVNEARQLSAAFNQRICQWTEKPFRTTALTGEDSAETRSQAISQLSQGKLDYIFTVELFNEGIDIPAINEIVMLRQTESSIIFTQQLGRGLRTYPGKDIVTVIDFIGNYANNYLIPLALYGNTGNREVTSRDLDRTSIGLSSISFDRIAKERVLASIEHADLSDWKKLRDEYTRLRNMYGRIPMLVDFFNDTEMQPSIIASKKSDYLSYVIANEKSLQSKARRDGVEVSGNITPLDQLLAIPQEAYSFLKFLSSIVVDAKRPYEGLILAALLQLSITDICDFSQSSSNPSKEELLQIARELYPQLSPCMADIDSALRVLDFSYFTASSKKRFNQQPLLEPVNAGRIELTDAFKRLYSGNSIFADFAQDTITTGFLVAQQRIDAASQADHSFARAFIVGEQYSLNDIMRLCDWENELPPLNVGGYRYDPNGTMPILIKYGASQYPDHFDNAQELTWCSKNGRTLDSPEFEWLKQPDRFVPVFVRSKRYADISNGGDKLNKTYSFIGTVQSVSGSHLVDSGADHFVQSKLHLEHPLDEQFYHRLVAANE